MRAARLSRLITVATAIIVTGCWLRRFTFVMARRGGACVLDLMALGS